MEKVDFKKRDKALYPAEEGTGLAICAEALLSDGGWRRETPMRWAVLIRRQ